MTPKRLGKYVLADLLNRGGMADVFLAKSLGFGGADTLVALKCIRPELSSDDEFIRMFVEEAKLSVLLSHANIAKTYELGTEGSTYFIAMEYIAGRDLRAILDRARAEGLGMPEHLALAIAAWVCEGLDYAHRKTDLTGVPLRIVHRDVSPQNVLISYQGEVKLIDFGIAKAATEASRTGVGVLKGKYGYMSPEQVSGGAIDARSDVFAAGVLLYELLTGERLFVGGSDFSILEKVRNAEVLPPTLVNPRLPAPIDELVLRALRLPVAERYASAGEMGEAIISALLSRYGPPSSRELTNLMASLFGAEIREDQRRLEHARNLDPASAEPMVESDAVEEDPSAPHHTMVDRPLGGKTTVDRVPVAPPPAAPPAIPAAMAPPPAPRPPADEPRPPHERTERVMNPFLGSNAPTKSYQAYDRPAWYQRLSREAWIVVAAVALAFAMIFSSWYLTRPPGTRRAGSLMVITIPPGAKVTVDGSVRGATPLSVGDLPAGPHTVQIDRPGFRRVVKRVDIAAGKTQDLSETLISQ